MYVSASSNNKVPRLRYEYECKRSRDGTSKTFRLHPRRFVIIRVPLPPVRLRRVAGENPIDDGQKSRSNVTKKAERKQSNNSRQCRSVATVRLTQQVSSLLARRQPLIFIVVLLRIVIDCAAFALCCIARPHEIQFAAFAQARRTATKRFPCGIIDREKGNQRLYFAERSASERTSDARSQPAVHESQDLWNRDATARKSLDLIDAHQRTPFTRLSTL